MLYIYLSILLPGSKAVWHWAGPVSNQSHHQDVPHQFGVLGQQLSYHHLQNNPRLICT